MNDNEPVVTGIIDTNATLRDLMDVAGVALGPGMPTLPRPETRALLDALLAAIDHTMPPELQHQHVSVVSARTVRRFLDS